MEPNQEEKGKKEAPSVNFKISLDGPPVKFKLMIPQDNVEIQREVTQRAFIDGTHVDLKTKIRMSGTEVTTEAECMFTNEDGESETFKTDPIVFDLSKHEFVN